ncbi:hypothetical protein ACXR2T_08020 [Leucobacter sp. HY1910]
MNKESTKQEALDIERQELGQLIRDNFNQERDRGDVDPWMLGDAILAAGFTRGASLANEGDDSANQDPRAEAARATLKDHLPIFSAAHGDRRWCSTCDEDFDSKDAAHQHALDYAMAAALKADPGPAESAAQIEARPDIFKRRESWGSVSASQQGSDGRVGRYVAVKTISLRVRLFIAVVAMLSGVVSSISIFLAMTEAAPDFVLLRYVQAITIAMAATVAAAVTMEPRQAKAFIARDDTGSTASAVRTAVPQGTEPISRSQRRALVRALCAHKLDQYRTQSGTETARSLAADRAAGAL